MCLAIPAQVVEFTDAENRLALVDVAGVQRRVNVGLLDGTDTPVDVGDWVLVHVGFAISRVDEAEAMEALETEILAQLGIPNPYADRERMD